MIKFIVFSLTFLSSNIVLSNNHDLKLSMVIDYLYGTEEFESNFLQNEEGSISEGKLYIKNKRIKIEYEKPSRIAIILTKNKAMYFNKDLNEVEYFNPQNTIGDIFYDVFFDNNFLKDAKIFLDNNNIKIQKKTTINNERVSLEVYLEDNPIIIKRITLKSENRLLELNIINPNFNPTLDKKFFSLISPKIK